MPLIQHVYPWDSQPQEAVGIDWSNPITNRLVFCAESFVGLRDMVRGIAPANTVGHPTHAATRYGVASEFASAVTGYGSGQLFTGSEATFQIIEIPNNVTQVAGLFNKRPAFNSENAFSLGYNYTIGNEFSVEFGNANGVGGSVGLAYSFTRSFFSTAGNNIVVTANTLGFSANRIKAWVNGVSVPEAGVPGANDNVAAIYGGTAPIEIGRVNSGSLYYAGRILVVRAWDRILTEPEIMALSDAPWQIFAPRVQYIPTSASVLMPTLGIPTFVPGSLTSGGFRPRFPVTWA